MKNDKQNCRLQNSFFENSLNSEETFSLVGVISFVSLNLYFLAPVFSYNQINKQPENLYELKLQRMFRLFQSARRDLVVLTM